MKFFLVNAITKVGLFLAEKPKSELEELIVEEIIGNIINGIVMPIIYAALGGLLIIKGAMLGTQIVKSADEPEVRQQKINSLKYLVIGVVVAAGVAALAQILVTFISKQFVFGQN